jgi:hypothetical protein
MERGNDSAVSEVVSEIIILALVVILAAVIAAMVFGLFGNLQPTNITGVTAVRGDPGQIVITYNGGERADQLKWLNISVNGGISPSLGTYGSVTPLSIGNSTVVAGPSPGKDHVIVTGYFSDGTVQVVLDTTV